MHPGHEVIESAHRTTPRIRVLTVQLHTCLKYVSMTVFENLPAFQLMSGSVSEILGMGILAPEAPEQTPMSTAEGIGRHAESRHASNPSNGSRQI